MSQKAMDYVYSESNEYNKTANINVESIKRCYYVGARCLYGDVL